MKPSPLFLALPCLLPAILPAQMNPRDDASPDLRGAGTHDIDTAEANTSIAPVPVPEARPLEREKHFGTAYLWAFGATMLPIAAATLAPDDDAAALIIAGSLILGPSAGQYYAGSYAKGAAATGFRLAAIPAGFLGGFMATSLSGGSDDGDGFSGLEAMAAFATGALVAGGTVLAVGTVYSLIDTKFAVDRANERARGARAALSPALFPLGDGRIAPGLALHASF